MTVQILRKKFTVGQYHQMLDSGVLTEGDSPLGRGRVSLPSATYPTTQSTSLIEAIAALGAETAPLPEDVNFALDTEIMGTKIVGAQIMGVETTPLPGGVNGEGGKQGDRPHSGLIL